MGVLFQAAELEDWAVNYGCVNNTGAYFNPANARANVFASLGSDFTYGVQSFPFSANEFWSSFVIHASATGSTPSKFFTLEAGGIKRIAISQSAAASTMLRAFQWNGSAWDTTVTAGLNSMAQAAVRTKYDVFVKLGNPGILRVYKDGLPVIAVTPDYSFGGLANLDTMGLWGSSAAGGTTTYFSEAIVATWNTIGSKLVTRVPDANGNYTAWLGGGFGAVDEVILGTDFLTSAAADQRVSFSLTDFPALVAGEVINTVGINSFASRDGGGPSQMNHFTRIGSTDYDAANKTLSVAQAAVRTNFDVSPATGIAWTIAELNAAQFGMRSRT